MNTDQSVTVTVSPEEARQLGRFWRVVEGHVSITMPKLYATELHLRLTRALVPDYSDPPPPEAA